MGSAEWFLLEAAYAQMVFPGGSEVKVSACNAGDLGSIPGLGISPGEGNGYPRQYSCLENSMTEEPGRLPFLHEATKTECV